MTFSITQLFLFFSGLGLALYFFTELKIREIAFYAAREHCESMNVQLLDQSIGIHRVWLKRGKDDQLHFWRNYQFEFTSTGDERYKGNVITLGTLIETIYLQPHKLPDTEQH